MLQNVERKGEGVSAYEDRERYHSSHGIAEKVLRAMRLDVEEKGQKLSMTEGGKQGKSEVIVSCSWVEVNC